LDKNLRAEASIEEENEGEGERERVAWKLKENMK